MLSINILVPKYHSHAESEEETKTPEVVIQEETTTPEVIHTNGFLYRNFDAVNQIGRGVIDPSWRFYNPFPTEEQ